MASLMQQLQYTLMQADPALSNETRRVLLKEVLQAYTLDFLYNHSLYRQLNFYGGTCLHVVYGLNRLSEDLDLDNGIGIPLGDLENDVLDYFQQTTGYKNITSKTQLGERGIHRLTIKFSLLADLGLSDHTNEVLHLKLEVSQHQQLCMIQKTPIYSYGKSFVAAHFSLETMMAGKMLACLERNFKRGRHGAAIKGRDFYDLLWFMQKKIQPLEEKLAVDGEKSYSTQSAMLALTEMISSMKRTDLAVDLYPLFTQRTFIDSWLDNYTDNFALWVKAYL